MVNLLGSVALAYLAGSGTVTNTGVVGRGLFRAERKAVDGGLRGAGVQAAGAQMAPALMSYPTCAALVLDVAGGAGALIKPVLADGEDFDTAVHLRAA